MIFVAARGTSFFYPATCKHNDELLLSQHKLFLAFHNNNKALTHGHVYMYMYHEHARIINNASAGAVWRMAHGELRYRYIDARRSPLYYVLVV